MINKKITVLLVHPEVSRTKYNFKGIIENECLELEYISSMLKEKGHTVHLFDTQVEDITVNSKIKNCKPDLIYICGRTKQESFMLEYCESAKKINENIVTVLGGIHAQLCYNRLYSDYVDYILTTFDIFSLLDVIEFCFFDKNTILNNVEGICYKEDGKWIKTKQTPFDISRLPLPDRTYFYNHPDRYQYLECKHAAWVRTAYSCPYRCKFCIRNKLNSSKYVRRNIEDVVGEIKNITSENIYLVDDDFLVDIKRVKKFISLIKENNIRKNFICYGRSDFIAENESLMQAFKDVGLYYVLVGLEATNDKNLDLYNKKNSVGNNVKSIEICNRLGINIMGMFIIDPDYTPQDFSSLYKWIKDNKLRHVAISIFTPELCSENYDIYKDRLITNDPSHWDYLHQTVAPSHMSVKRYYLHYYILLIKLFLKAKREGVYDFIDYGDYIKSFLKNIFRNPGKK